MEVSDQTNQSAARTNKFSHNWFYYRYSCLLTGQVGYFKSRISMSLLSWVIQWLEHPENFQEYNNRSENAIKTFENHSSIVKIKSNISPTQKMLFAFLNTDDFKKEIGKLDISKTFQMLDIPTRLINQNWYFFRFSLCKH